MRRLSDIAFVALVFSNCLFAATPGSTEMPIDFSQQCFNGGIRKTTGTYDTTTGALNLKLAVKECKDKDNSSHDGIVTTSGSITPSDTPGVFIVDTVKQYNTHDVNSVHDLQSTCTHHRVGKFLNRPGFRGGHLV
jgi:hypothetical protein